MITDAVETKICTSCDRRREITEFRRFNRDSEKRQPQCNQCRNMQSRLKRQKATAQQIRAVMRELRRSKTVERMADFVDALAERFGGKNKLIEMWADLLKSDSLPPTFQVATARTLMHVTAALDTRRAADQLDVLQSEEPIEAVRRLHQAGRLFPGLREMYYQGDFSWDELLDGVDPPPQ